MSELVKATLRPAPPGSLAGITADVVLRDSSGDAYTLTIRDGTVDVCPGRPARAPTEISVDRRTAVAVASGRRSGVEALLAGDISVRGILALALGLDGLLEHDTDREVAAELFTQSHVTMAHGVRTFHLKAGSAAGTTMVCLHGLGATNASMLPVLFDLGRDRRVLAPDLPGHRGTQAPLASYDVSYFCPWLLDWLDEVGLSQAILVGNTLGGRIATEVALRHPDRVEALVLLCPAVTFRRLRQLVPFLRWSRPKLGALAFPMFLVEPAVRPTVRRTRAKAGPVPPGWLDAAAHELVRCYRRPHRQVPMLSAFRQACEDDAFGRGGFWTRLSSLRAATLCVGGSDDRLVPAAFSRHVSNVLPMSTSVDDCRHAPQLEQREQTARVIRSFLTTLSREPA